MGNFEVFFERVEKVIKSLTASSLDLKEMIRSQEVTIVQLEKRIADLEDGNAKGD